VTIPSQLSQESLLSFTAFKNWISTLERSLKAQSAKDHPFHEAPYKLRRIDVQAVDFFGRSKVGFIKLKAIVENDHGEKIPGSTFLRGGSVAMLVSQFPWMMASAVL